MSPSKQKAKYLSQEEQSPNAKSSSALLTEAEAEEPEVAPLKPPSELQLPPPGMSKGEVLQWTSEHLVPEALLALKGLLKSQDPKIKKQAADKVFELIDLGGKKDTKGSSGITVSLDREFFNAAQEGLKMVNDAQEKLTEATLQGERS